MNPKIRKIISKKNISKIVSLTAYSKNIAKILDKYCDIVLVGDSLANVLYGHKNTRSINLKNMIEHSKSVKKGISKSLLDQIEGIGSIRKRSLLNHFGSARAVESASLDEIKSVEGVEEKVAKKIYNFFHE